MDNKKQSDEHHKPTEENVVKDLRKSLEDAIDQTKHILVDLEQTVETTIKDQSISEETKKIVDSISDEIKNSTLEGSQKIINTTKAINNFEEE